ncbi:MAG: DNA repair protein RadA, partial [Rhodospirillales bacterium]|nr:DNA repair protein RadA [Rhodospirillales bacterium]
MARKTAQYICQQCGASHPKWAGQCPDCMAWNSLSEESVPDATPKGLGAKKGRPLNFVGLKGESEKEPRLVSGINEFDRVTGGGLVPGSAILIGGDPGVGKSTLVLQ